MTPPSINGVDTGGGGAAFHIVRSRRVEKSVSRLVCDGAHSARHLWMGVCL